MRHQDKRLRAFRALYRAVGNLSLSFYDAARRSCRSETDAALWASASLVRALANENDRAPNLLRRITAAPFPRAEKAAR